jgi:hypothetical protein
MQVDQDGLGIALALFAVLILFFGLRRGVFEIQFIRASRSDSPVAYWIIAAILAAVAIELARRAWSSGCPDCL